MHIRKIRWAGIGLIVGLVVGGMSWAGAHGGDTSRIHACVADRGGAVRVIGPNESCKKGETPLDWNITGPSGTAGRDGTDGRTVWNGSGAPASGLGAPGDFYIDTESSVLHGPKADGAWPTGVSLVGPAGPVGPADLDSLAGGPCATGTPGVGVLAIAYGSSGEVTLTCQPTTRHLLTVSKAGSGQGTVTSWPAGIACGATCSATFVYGTGVRVTAQAPTGFTFTGWSGACVGQDSLCDVAMSEAKAVTATFVAALRVTIQIPGGGGSVMSSIPSLYCPGSCAADVPAGTAVTLRATPSEGWAFAGWSGACTGTGSCAVTVASDVTITATFTQLAT